MALKKQLDNSYVLLATIESLTITTFGFDLGNQFIHIGYSANTALGVYQADIPLTLSGTDYTDFIARVNEIGATMSGLDAEYMAALEYIPGNGTIISDTKTLNNPYDIGGTVIGQEIDSYAFSPSDRLIHIGYSLLESINSSLLNNVLHTLSGPEVDDFTIRFNELEGTMTVTKAQLQTCLEFLPGSGTIVDV